MLHIIPSNRRKFEKIKCIENYLKIELCLTEKPLSAAAIKRTNKPFTRDRKEKVEGRGGRGETISIALNAIISLMTCKRDERVNRPISIY